jgi:hypothetical protein
MTWTHRSDGYYDYFDHCLGLTLELSRGDGRTPSLGFWRWHGALVCMVEAGEA